MPSFKTEHAVRCVAVVATSLGVNSATARRFFLHTGPRALSTEHCRIAAVGEGATDASENLKVRHFAS